MKINKLYFHIGSFMDERVAVGINSGIRSFAEMNRRIEKTVTATSAEMENFSKSIAPMDLFRNSPLVKVIEYQSWH